MKGEKAEGQNVMTGIKPSQPYNLFEMIRMISYSTYHKASESMLRLQRRNKTKPACNDKTATGLFVPMMGLKLATPLGYKPSALAIEVNSSKAIVGKELSLSSWCIASLYVCHFATVVDFSSEKYNGSTVHSNAWYQ